MAFEKLGIGGVLTFNDTQAVAGMTRTKMLMRNLETRAQRLAAGMRRLGMAVKSLGMISIASAAGLGFGAKAAADFEHQMGAVAAVSNSTGKELRKNADYARRLGIETAFSATQAAKAMEILAKFGLTGAALRTATKGVTDLAAATGTNMQSAATTMIGTLKSMSLTSKDSTRVANVLALASTKTAANAIGLGEAFAYAGSTAQSMKMPLEMTAAVFGLLADKMMIGSRAGTGLMALLRGLQGNTKKIRDTMKGLGIDVKKFGGDMRRLPEIIDHINTQLNKHFPKASDNIDKARAVTAMFGRFGQVTFNNLAATGRKKLEELSRALAKSGAVAKDKFGNAIGAAAVMAKKRLDTTKGAITLFKSSMESFFISIMGGFLGPMKTRLQNLTTQFNKVLFVMQAFEKDDSLQNQQKMMKKYGRTAVQVALGVRDALKMVRDVWKFVGDQIRKVGAMFSGVVGKGMLRTVVKFALGIAMLLATIAPLFAGLLAMKFLVGLLANSVVGLVIVIKAAALPVLAVVAAVAAAFLILRKEGESVRETFTRLFQGVYAFGTELVNGVLKPVFNTVMAIVRAFTVDMQDFWEGFLGRIRKVIYSIVGSFKTAVRAAMTLVKPLLGLVKAIAMKLRAPFRALFSMLATLAEVIAKVTAALVGLFKTVVGWVRTVVNYIKPMIMDVVGFISKLATTIYNVLSRLFSVIGSIVQTVINMTRRLLDFLKPALVIFLKLVRVAWNLGKVIFSLVLAPIKIFWAIISKIYGVVKGPLLTAFKAIGGVLGWLIGLIKTVAKFIFTILLAPFKLMAKVMAKLMWGVAKIAKWIPGVSSSAIRGLARSLEEFAGVAQVTRRRGLSAAALARRQKIVAAQRAAVAPFHPTGLLAVDPRYPVTREPGQRPIQNTIIDKRTLNVNARTSIDGRCVAAASSRHQVELNERAGFGTTPWQRRAVVARSGLVNPRGRN